MRKIHEELQKKQNLTRCLRGSLRRGSWETLREVSFFEKEEEEEGRRQETEEEDGDEREGKEVEERGERVGVEGRE